MDEWLIDRLQAHPVLTPDDIEEIRSIAFGICGFGAAKVEDLDRAVDGLSALVVHWRRGDKGHSFIDRHKNKDA